MSFEEFKKKANEIKDNLEPKIKDKAKKAKKSVSEFVDDHFTKKEDDVEEKAAEAAEAVEEAVEAVENGAAETVENIEEKAEEAAERIDDAVDETADKAENKKEDFFSKIKNAAKKKAKKVKFKEADAEEAEETEDAGSTAEDDDTADTAGNEADTAEKVEGEVTDGTEEKTDIEKIEGEVVGSLKDKYNQFKTVVLPKVKQTASNVGSKVAETAKDLAPKAKDAAINAGSKVKEVAKELAPKAKETAANAGSVVKDTASTVGSKVKETASSFGSKVKDTARDFGPRAKQVGPKMYEGAKKAGETISFQGYRLRKSLGKTVKNSIKKKLGLKVDDEAIKYYEVKKKTPNKLIAHTRTVVTHRHMVLKHCIKAGIPVQGLTHDLSKFSPSEFIYGVKFYKGDKSPNEGEREDHGFSYAWMHHKGRNKHHFEYWNDYNIEANKALPVKMPLKYVIEMFCDRVAASKVYLKDKYTCKSPYEYFDKGRSRRTIHQETSDFLEKLLKMLAEKGESYTFMYIKWYKKHHKDY